MVYIQDKFLEMELLSLRINLYVVLIHIIKFSSVDVIISSLPSNLWECPFLTALAQSALSSFWAFVNLMGEKWYFSLVLICMSLDFLKLDYS